MQQILIAVILYQTENSTWWGGAVHPFGQPFPATEPLLQSFEIALFDSRAQSSSSTQNLGLSPIICLFQLHHVFYY